ncbi:MAG: sigma-70 family RNA polymerase sigma factor [Actinomycetota bacterium]
MNLSERFPTVLAAARRGEPWAWTAIYHLYAPKILGYLRARNAFDPEDLLGEVLVAIVRDIGQFDGDERAFRAWLFTVAHHRMLDDIRSRSRRPQTEDIDTAVYVEPAGNVENEALDMLDDQRVRALLSRLSDDQQTVLLLRVFAGMTSSQIAAAIGKNTGSVKALQHRGLAVLRRLLSEEIGDDRVLSGADGALQVDGALQKEGV